MGDLGNLSVPPPEDSRTNPGAGRIGGDASGSTWQKGALRESVSARSGCLSLSPLHPSISSAPLRRSVFDFHSLSIFLIDDAPSPGFISLPETSRLLQLPLVVAADGRCVCDNLSLPRLVPFLILTFPPPSPFLPLEAWLDVCSFGGCIT